MQRSFICRVSCSLFVAAAALLWAPEALAQCEVPACNMPGERYERADGDCHTGPDPITRAESHRIPSCRADETFVRATGMCRLNACTSSSCDARALCGGQWPNYARSGRDSTGAYGVCESNPNWLGHRSHTILRCASGYALSEGRGICVSCPVVTPVPIRRPDLVISRAFLRQVPGGPLVTRVRAGRSYLACVVVTNIGDAESGAFHVGGGGLGVRTPPSVPVPTLRPGASSERCLVYATTPPVGTYRLVIDADSRNVVAERRNDNNTATIAVIVIP